MSTKKVVRILLLVLGLSILGYFLYTIEFSTLLGSVEQLNVKILLLILALTITNILVKALRWKVLIAKITKKSITLWFSFVSIIAGVAAGSFLPARIEMAKPFLLKTEKDVRFSHSISALFLERLFDFLTLIFLLFVALVFIPRQNVVSIPIIIAFTVILVGGTIVMIYFPERCVRIGQKILEIVPLPKKIRDLGQGFCERFFKSFSILRRQSVAGTVGILSLVANGLEVLRIQLILYFFSVDITLATTAFVFAAVVFISIITLIPGGIGITEISMAGLFLLLSPGIQDGVIKSVILIDRFFSFYLLTFLGTAILFWYSRHGTEKHKT